MQSSSVRSPGSENLVLDPEVVQPGPARPVVAVDDEADNLGLLVQGADSHQRDSVLCKKGELQIILTFAVFRYTAAGTHRPLSYGVWQTERLLRVAPLEGLTVQGDLDAEILSAAPIFDCFYLRRSRQVLELWELLLLSGSSLSGHNIGIDVTNFGFTNYLRGGILN